MPVLAGCCYIRRGRLNAGTPTAGRRAGAPDEDRSGGLEIVQSPQVVSRCAGVFKQNVRILHKTLTFARDYRRDNLTQSLALHGASCRMLQITLVLALVVVMLRVTTYTLPSQSDIILRYADSKLIERLISGADHHHLEVPKPTISQARPDRMKPAQQAEEPDHMQACAGSCPCLKRDRTGTITCPCWTHCIFTAPPIPP
eukprot:1355981-Pyramimonas_sp.AAC.2